MVVHLVIREVLRKYMNVKCNNFKGKDVILTLMRILDHIYLLADFANSYLIEREKYCILVDTGPSKRAKKILQSVKSHSQDKPLAAILITHAHYDHLAGLESVGLYFGPEVISHHKENRFIMGLERFPSRKGLMGRMIGIFINTFSAQSYTVDRVVTDAEVIYDMKIHHLPGHTPGSIALEDTISGALFTGDAVITNRRGTKLRPPSKIYALDYNQALESSIKLLKSAQPKAILPGHGKPMLNPEEAINKYLQKYS